MKYLIMKCEELNDQYECDAYRYPVRICDKIPKQYKKYGYEHYEIDSNGFLKLIKDYTES